MPVDVVLGLQWGDEGKGKIVDFLAPTYDVVARFQGGPNAGHTLFVHGKKLVLHTIPSGVLHDKPVNLIGNGVVIDPANFLEEIAQLSQLGIALQEKLVISHRAHLILPTHRLVDAFDEASKGETRIGSTLKGIGPAYVEKMSRQGLRMGDILAADFRDRYQALKNKHLKQLPTTALADLANQEQMWWQGIEQLRSFPIISTEDFLHRLLSRGGQVLAEGAQGAMLDIDFGTYPYVTSSSTIAGGACTGLGVSPKWIHQIIGVIKAYCTRVGSGPFPTELTDATGELLRQQGNEYGATTGRPRRCGWLDLVAVRYAARISGATQLVLTKADVLNRFETVYYCTAYQDQAQVNHDFPYDLHKARPLYEMVEGWRLEPHATHLPPTLMHYIRSIEQFTGIPVQYLSTGADRQDMISLRRLAEE